MSTKETIGPFDALEKAEPGEPMFPLLARDACAPATITEWCRLRRNLAYRNYGESTNPKDELRLAAELQQCAHAEEKALQMQAWRENHAEEAPAGERASYQEITRTAEELAEAGRRQRKEELCRYLREAASYISDASAGLADLGFPHSGEKLAMILIAVNAIADEHEAKRPNFTAEPILPMEMGK